MSSLRIQHFQCIQRPEPVVYIRVPPARLAQQAVDRVTRRTIRVDDGPLQESLAQPETLPNSPMALIMRYSVIE